MTIDKKMFKKKAYIYVYSGGEGITFNGESSNCSKEVAWGPWPFGLSTTQLLQLSLRQESWTLGEEGF